MKELANSLLFFTCAREAICLAVEDVDTSGNLKKFVVNEATDYDVLSLLTTGKFPETQGTVFDEMILLDILKEQVERGYPEVFDFIGEDATYEFVNEVEILRQYGISSQMPVLEKMFETKSLIDPSDFWIGVGASVDSVLEAILTEQEPPMMDIPGWVNDPILTKQLTALIKRGKDIAKAMAGASGEKLAKLSKELAFVKKDIAGRLRDARSAIGTGVQKLGKKIMPGSPAPAAQAATFLKGLPGAPAVAKALGISATQAGGVIALGGVAAAALLLYAAVKTYKRYLSKAAKACAGRSGRARTACIAQARAGAVQAQLADLRNGMAGCAKTKQPEKCKLTIQKQVAKLSKRHEKYSKDARIAAAKAS